MFTVTVSYLASQVSIFAAKHDSMVIAVSIVTATCLVKVNFSSSQLMCAA